MNIFFLSIDNKQCVIMHVNKHVVKMILEHTQILCSVHHVCGSLDPNFKIPYKLSHKNHPCNIWARESLSNYNYLIDLSIELCKEYTYRYGKVHKSEQYIRQMQTSLPNIQDKGFTRPARAMPEQYKLKKENVTFEDVVESYRNYYFYDKKHIFNWKKRAVPEFIKEMEENERMKLSDVRA